ncbi:flagellar assembly protein FliH [Bacillus sp. V3B]|uniref:flagellar assembly protein FliH n=1 Tax=Bacillus sp. V3B TaxID=2804915 RepID=UPI00210AFD6C|nr:flagellar assembly protein FliH [Bacillus sp. V3B]MCQ6274093.1 flagellar assembly protein FliH [Bacillus sp. V3B]
MSRLIKSQWSNPTLSEKKIISIKMFNTPEKVENDFDLKEENIIPTELVEEARLEAEQIRQQVKSEMDALYAEIQSSREDWEREKGLLISAANEEGYKAGWEEGQRQGYSEYQELLKDAQKIIQVAKYDYHAYLETSEKTILDLSIKVAQKVLKTKIEENGDCFISLVKKAVKEVKEFQDVKIHVHPVHYENLLAKKDELLSVFSQDTNLFIYPDSDLLESSCLIESPYGRIDVSIDTQLSEIKQKLTECLESETS